MKILAMDQSSSACAWAFLIGGSLIDFGVYNPNKKDPIVNRIYSVAEFVIDMVEKSKPDMVVFENVQNQSNDMTLINLSKLLGILEYTVHKLGIKCITLSPSMWRAHFGFGKSVDGVKPKREGLKKLAIQYVLDTYKVEATEDECEAILIGVAAGMLPTIILPPKPKAKRKAK